VGEALARAGHRAVRLELGPHHAESQRTGGYEVCFPVAHGAVGEDGSLQGLLEVLELAYVGSGVLASAMAMHKDVARVLFERAGLPVAKGIVIDRGDAPAAAERARRELGARVVVKPSSQGSAIGVARLDERASTAEVAGAIEATWAIDERALIETFVEGREVTCGVLELDGEGAVALPPTEIFSPQDAFYTYRARYVPGRSVHVCPAHLAPDMLRSVQRVALAAHLCLGCRDLSRVDFIVGEQGLTLLEVNTLPGMTPTSLYPEAAAARGLSMPSLCDALVRRAHARGAAIRQSAVPLPG
jgi:D-alanine-D-alanine ligase